MPVVWFGHQWERTLEKRGLVNSENIQTIIVVGFILALLGLVLAMFNAYKMTSAAHVATDWLEHYSTTSAETQAEVQALRGRLTAMEKELAEMRKLRSQPMLLENAPGEKAGN